MSTGSSEADESGVLKHNAVKTNIVNPSGAALVSYNGVNNPAEHYDWVGGQNDGMTLLEMQKYTGALQWLLSNQSIQLSDTKRLVYYADEIVSCDWLTAMLNPYTPITNDVINQLSAAYTGKQVTTNNKQLKYIVLEGDNGRIGISDFGTISTEVLLKNYKVLNELGLTIKKVIELMVHKSETGLEKRSVYNWLLHETALPKIIVNNMLTKLNTANQTVQTQLVTLLTIMTNTIAHQPSYTLGTLMAWVDYAQTAALGVSTSRTPYSQKIQKNPNVNLGEIVQSLAIYLNTIKKTNAGKAIWLQRETDKIIPNLTAMDKFCKLSFWQGVSAMRNEIYSKQDNT